MSTSPSKAQPASFFQRFLAFTIDGYLLFIPTLLWLKWAVDASEVSQLGYRFMIGLVLILLPSILVSFLYYVLGIAWYGQTLGKKLLGIQVVPVGKTKITVGVAFFREVIAKAVSMYPFYWGCFAMIRHSEKKTWHDRMTGTKVVQSQETPWILGLVLAVVLVVLTLWLGFQTGVSLAQSAWFTEITSSF